MLVCLLVDTLFLHATLLSSNSLVVIANRVYSFCIKGGVEVAQGVDDFNLHGLNL